MLRLVTPFQRITACITWRRYIFTLICRRDKRILYKLFLLLHCKSRSRRRVLRAGEKKLKFTFVSCLLRRSRRLIDHCFNSYLNNFFFRLLHYSIQWSATWLMFFLESVWQLCLSTHCSLFTLWASAKITPMQPMFRYAENKEPTWIRVRLMHDYRPISKLI